jgi:hypothetical protein
MQSGSARKFFLLHWTFIDKHVSYPNARFNLYGLEKAKPQEFYIALFDIDIHEQLTSLQ